MAQQQSLITPELIEKIIMIESSNNPQAISPAGARGLMQLMPIAWKDVQQNRPDLAEFAYDDYWMDEETNKLFGTEYLKLLEKRLPEGRKTVDNLASAYNWGLGNLKKVDYDLSRLPSETRRYLEKLAK